MLAERREGSTEPVVGKGQKERVMQTPEGNPAGLVFREGFLVQWHRGGAAAGFGEG